MDSETNATVPPPNPAAPDADERLSSGTSDVVSPDRVADDDESRPDIKQSQTETDTGGDRIPTGITPENKQVLRDKMKDLFAKFISNIDDHVLDVGKSQCELDAQLDKLIETLDSIKIDEKLTVDISENAKRISALKSRLTVIHTILSDASARCSRTLTACGAALQKAPASVSSTASNPPDIPNSDSNLPSLKQRNQSATTDHS